MSVSDADPDGAMPRRPRTDPSKDAQQVAINHGKGPCLVLAAPGSGKTWVITKRFVRLVEKEKLKPREILALTFNADAAKEMVDRVQGEIGQISVGRPLTTYNAFAYDLVKRNAWRLPGWTPQVFKLASAAQERQLMREAIAEVAPKWYDPGRPNQEVKGLLSIFSQAKGEMVTPPKYLEWVHTQREKATTPEEHRDLDRERDRTFIYSRYQDKLRERGLGDHDDCLVFAAELLKLPEVREQYDYLKYVMVDEYQDTNTAQALMVQRLFPRKGRANLFVVADDDQAIYGFRGASRSNIKRFMEAYQRPDPAAAGNKIDPKTLTLPVNRRSTPEIMEVANTIIAKAENRYPKEAEPMRPHGEKVRLISAQRPEDEARAVVQTIKEKLDAGASYRDIAILARGTGDMRHIILALQGSSLPYAQRGGNDYFSHTEVKIFVALMSAIADPKDSQALLVALRVPKFGVDGLGLWWIEQAARRRGAQSAFELLLDPNNEYPILHLPENQRVAGQEFAKQLLNLHNESAIIGVDKLFEAAMIWTDMAGYNDVARPAEQAQVVANLQRFRNILVEFTKESPHGTVGDALKYIRELEESSVESVAPIGEELDAIRISTVHAAKGREWQHVIVVGCDSEGFPGRWRGERDILPRDLADDPVLPKDAHYEEERRLFYVASTRAKDSLTYTWSQRSVADDRSNRQRNQSQFLAAIPENLLDKREQPPTQAILMRPPIVPEILSNDKISVSFSALQAFKACPRRYQYRMEGKPQAREDRSVFGSLLHDTLDHLTKQRMGGQHITPAIAETVWDKLWETTTESLGSGDGPDHRKVGRQIISDYIRSPYWQHANAKASEMRFEIKIGEDLYFNGKFDRLDMVDSQPVLIDYKSGAPKDPDDLRDNRQQLLYYAVALREIWREEHGIELEEVRTQIHWVNSQGITMEDRGLTFNTKQLDKAKETLTGNLETIRNARLSGNFEVKPSAWNCGSCAFRLSCHEGRALIDQESLHHKSRLYEQYGPKDQLKLFPNSEMQRMLKQQKDTFSGLEERPPLFDPGKEME